MWGRVLFLWYRGVSHTSAAAHTSTSLPSQPRRRNIGNSCHPCRTEWCIWFCLAQSVVLLKSFSVTEHAVAKAGFAHSQLHSEMFTGVLRKSADENTVVLEDIPRHGFTAAFFFARNRTQMCCYKGWNSISILFQYFRMVQNSFGGGNKVT